MRIRELMKLYAQRRIRPQEVIEECFRKIEETKHLGAFISLDYDGAMRTAQMLEKSFTKELPPLYGVPIAVKDLIDVAGLRTTAGSLFFKDNVAKEDAFVIQQLKKAGAIIVGKTNLHEIALGVTNNNPHFGPCRNPHDPARISGGSSGGSAVSVATNAVLAALGTDTGGSIRIPSALCGVVGLKPTYGRVSVRGVMPLSWHLDHVGPIANCVEDAWIVLKSISRYNAQDPFSQKAPLREPDFEKFPKGIRILKVTGNFVSKADERILKIMDEACEVLEQLGALIEEKPLEWLKDAAAANGLITQTEAAAFHRERLKQHPEMFSDDVRQRLMEGASTSGVDYAQARKIQTMTKHNFKQLFSQYDLLMLPTVPIVAPPIEGENAVEMARRLTRFTAEFNISHLPAISIPFGRVDGLPVGVQFVTKWWREDLLVQVAHAFERSTAHS
ncbi:MAG: Amidase [Thermotoga sp. 50_1627]|uniref:amidase n=1 Tax=Pseudothermotoga sp. TaxID=2033661 RepID=UPI00076DD55A|nr:MAG: Amidase [Thermotoga sp. 50_64]KUK24779.1 MAG: Amidase [Thermotoga sp. 50_1627]MBC7116458.1 amidase [Pseudothermotoga sp.]MDK2924123.1 aspartyl-tRNA(Asn)/glutamyl-tRNA(Gln) amidotransferase subunit [Pseudothermotoga sp.]HBT40317.1 Asp-tRNA(Asn)/Glu-tRNA(Gln) amidotransferase GatCAB subunit A [Pseudothermotoga sp.]